MEYRTKDFEIRAVSATLSEKSERDLFRPKVVIVQQPKMPPKPPEPPPKTQEELAREAAQAELLRIRCVAVSQRGTRLQAFLNIGDQNQLVNPGDQVGGRFVVDKITSEGVYLRDPVTEVAGQINISAK